MKTKTLNILVLLTLFFLQVSAQQPNTHIKITNIRNAKGNIVINLFKDPKSYEDQKPFKIMVFDKKGLSNGILSTSFELQNGVYGITLIDDENGNGKIDKNLIGIPKEGFGFSNYYMSGLSKPSFDEFKFNLTTTSNNIEIKIRYM